MPLEAQKNKMGKIKDYWNDNKNGALYGAFVGIVAWYVYSHYANINPLRASMMSSVGLMDKMMSYLPKENLATLKVMLLFVVGGAIIGMVIDSLTEKF